jgi:hypothetical protein
MHYSLIPIDLKIQTSLCHVICVNMATAIVFVKLKLIYTYVEIIKLALERWSSNSRYLTVVVCKLWPLSVYKMIVYHFTQISTYILIYKFICSLKYLYNENPKRGSNLFYFILFIFYFLRNQKLTLITWTPVCLFFIKLIAKLNFFTTQVNNVYICVQQHNINANLCVWTGKFPMMHYSLIPIDLKIQTSLCHVICVNRRTSRQVFKWSASAFDFGSWSQVIVIWLIWNYKISFRKMKLKFKISDSCCL